MLDENCSKNFLVDFEQKSLQVITKRKLAEKAKLGAEEAKRLKEDEEERKLIAEELPPADNPDDEW